MPDREPLVAVGVDELAFGNLGSVQYLPGLRTWKCQNQALRIENSGPKAFLYLSTRTDYGDSYPPDSSIDPEQLRVVSKNRSIRDLLVRFPGFASVKGFLRWELVNLVNDGDAGPGGKKIVHVGDLLALGKIRHHATNNIVPLLAQPTGQNRDTILVCKLQRFHESWPQYPGNSLFTYGINETEAVRHTSRYGRILQLHFSETSGNVRHQTLLTAVYDDAICIYTISSSQNGELQNSLSNESYNLKINEVISWSARADDPESKASLLAGLAFHHFPNEPNLALLTDLDGLQISNIRFGSDGPLSNLSDPHTKVTAIPECSDWLSKLNNGAQIECLNPREILTLSQKACHVINIEEPHLSYALLETSEVSKERLIHCQKFSVAGTSNSIIVLSSVRIFLINLEERSPLSIVHYRDPKDVSLRIAVCVVGKKLNLVLYSRITGICTVFQIHWSEESHKSTQLVAGPDVLHLAHPKKSADILSTPYTLHTILVEYAGALEQSVNFFQLMVLQDDLIVQTFLFSISDSTEVSEIELPSMKELAHTAPVNVEGLDRNVMDFIVDDDFDLGDTRNMNGGPSTLRNEGQSSDPSFAPTKAFSLEKVYRDKLRHIPDENVAEIDPIRKIRWRFQQAEEKSLSGTLLDLCSGTVMSNDVSTIDNELQNLVNDYLTQSELESAGYNAAAGASHRAICLSKIPLAGFVNSENAPSNLSDVVRVNNYLIKRYNMSLREDLPFAIRLAKEKATGQISITLALSSFLTRTRPSTDRAAQLFIEDAISSQKSTNRASQSSQRSSKKQEPTPSIPQAVNALLQLNALTSTAISGVEDDLDLLTTLRKVAEANAPQEDIANRWTTLLDDEALEQGFETTQFASQGSASGSRLGTAPSQSQPLSQRPRASQSQSQLDPFKRPAKRARHGFEGSSGRLPASQPVFAESRRSDAKMKMPGSQRRLEPGGGAPGQAGREQKQPAATSQRAPVKGEPSQDHRDTGNKTESVQTASQVLPGRFGARPGSQRQDKKAPKRRAGF